MINWKKYVDHIYIVNYTLSDQNYINHFYKELERVNINRYDIDYVTDFKNVDTPFYKKIYDAFFKSNDNYNYDYAFPCSMGHYYCMKHAQNNNYDRILILENDAIFYDDISVIIYLLDNAKYLFNSNKCDLFLGGSGLQNFNDKEIDYSFCEIHNITDEQLFVAGTTFNIYNRKAYNQYINLIENGTYYVIDMYDKIYNYNLFNVWISNPMICAQKEWDLIMNNLYKHYNMPLINAEGIYKANNERNRMIWEDGRNLHKLLAQALEHYNLTEKYKDIYEDCKKNFN